MTVAAEKTLLDPDKEYEIVDGQPEEKQMGGARQGGIGARLIARLVMYAELNQLGGVYGPDTTFQIGTNDRLPDVSFVSASRIPPEGEPEGKWLIPPDLAVEIISLNDLYEKVNSKVQEYLAAGVRQVWLISPEHRTITIYRSLTSVQILLEADELIGDDDLLPGFRCLVRELFKSPIQAQI